MINPNEKHTITGTVTALRRDRYDKTLYLIVTDDQNREWSELGFIKHKTLKVGDRVKCEIGFSIVGDVYGIKSLRKIRTQNNK